MKDHIHIDYVHEIGNLHDGVHFTTEIRMLCQNSLLFRFFFTPGNKETIVEICLTIEATQSSLVFIVNDTIMHLSINGRQSYIKVHLEVVIKLLNEVFFVFPQKRDLSGLFCSALQSLLKN